MSLFWAEHQKLWRAGLTRLATGLFLALLTALQLWSYQSANYGTMKADGSRCLDGPANIRERQAYARQWEVLTDETLQQMVSALQTARAADPEMDSERVNLYVLNDLLGSYWPELTDETQPYPSMLCWYANPASLTGLYDRRDAALRIFLENQFADPADQALFYRQDAQVERPLRYGWSEGWANLLGNGIGGFGQLFLPPVLGLVLSPVFAGEKPPRDAPGAADHPPRRRRAGPRQGWQRAGLHSGAVWAICGGSAAVPVRLSRHRRLGPADPAY